MLQWSPVLETGNTGELLAPAVRAYVLQWSPVLETGNTSYLREWLSDAQIAAMEPGLRDREYLRGWDHLADLPGVMLQWSPVLETGNTR